DRQLTLKVKQHPERARAYSGGLNEKGDRRPLDPPPIAQLLLTSKRTGKPCMDLLHNPYYMCYASLWHEDRDEEVTSEQDNGRGRALLTGTLVTSMARLKDVNNVDGAYFPFVNLVVMVEGTFRIMFTVFEIGGGVVHCRGKVCTAPFTSYGKAFPGVSESTALCRVFADQGVRLRVRKEPKLRRSKPAKQKVSQEEDVETPKVSLKRRRSAPSPIGTGSHERTGPVEPSTTSDPTAILRPVLFFSTFIWVLEHPSAKSSTIFQIACSFLAIGIRFESGYLQSR
ncbi:hypothetical protein HKX48_008215, partial [Thoreauomyces humboldtii]